MKHRKRIGLLLLLAIGYFGVHRWHGANAGPPVAVDPVSLQIDNLLLTLRASEAEHASGAYFPGIGAVFTLDVLKGPNAPSPTIGTRDWLIYLMTTYGAQLTAVPPRELIAFSADAYDYSTLLFHQVVISSCSSTIADSSRYAIWIDGSPQTPIATAGLSPGCASLPAASVSGTATAPAATPTTALTSTTILSPTPSPAQSTTAPTSTSVPAPTATTPSTDPGANLVRNVPVFTGHEDYTNLQLAPKTWVPLSGQWSFGPAGYTQFMTTRYDLISLFGRRLKGNYTWSAQFRYIQGSLGGGFAFNAPNLITDGGAQMVSFTAKGTFLQWGYYTAAGLFHYQGGRPVASAADGAWHTLSITVTGTHFAVSLDSVLLGTNIVLSGPPGGYAGLLSSTSEVTFRHVKLQRGA